MGDGFYRSKDLINSIKVLKEATKEKKTICKLNTTQKKANNKNNNNIRQSTLQHAQLFTIALHHCAHSGATRHDFTLSTRNLVIVTRSSVKYVIIRMGRRSALCWGEVKQRTDPEWRTRRHGYGWN